MTTFGSAASGQLERELNYYRRECNDLGARLLRLQEEQSQAFREARRSRTVAKLIREAYRLADRGSSPADISGPMLEVIVDNVMCDRAALLREEPVGSGRFSIVHAVGLPDGGTRGITHIPNAPAFFFTTAQSRIEPPAYELTGLLQLPYILWAHDRPTGQGLILGNRSESNVSRAFEAADQELIEGALSVYLDVLARKQAEQELRLAKQAAEEAVNARAAFMATLSHELRTPLNSIIGFSEMMASSSRHPPSLARSMEFADQINESGHHLLMLINDILEYSIIAKGPPMLHSQWLTLKQTAGAAVRAATAMSVKRGVTLTEQKMDPHILIHVDPLRLRQILNNLLSNAIKFTPSGGSVELSAGLLACGSLEIRVRDTGIGMRAEDVPRALEPFRQIDNAYTRSVPGTGLGLPITKGLVEAHGATMLIDSHMPGGTTVRVILPAARVRRTGEDTGLQAAGVRSEDPPARG